MTNAEAVQTTEFFHSITVEDLQKLSTSQYSIVSRFLRSWRLRKPVRTRLLARQGNVCALSGKALLNDGGTHVDHIWTIKEAVAAVLSGARLGETYVRLWDDNNLRAVTPEENYKRNRKGN